jgi:hypothetical protein
MSTDTDPSNNSKRQSADDNKPASDSIQQTEDELANATSAWTEIENVISYDAESENQTEEIATQPTNTHSESQQTEVNDQAPTDNPPNKKNQNTQQEFDTKLLDQLSVSGVTNSARFAEALMVVVKTITVIVIAAVAWYAYQRYLR